VHWALMSFLLEPLRLRFFTEQILQTWEHVYTKNPREQSFRLRCHPTSETALVCAGMWN